MGSKRIAVWGMCVFLVGCGSQVDENQVAGVETLLEPDVIEAGGQSTVRCLVSNNAGETRDDLNTDFRITPESGWSRDGDTIEVIEAGTYHVSCYLPDHDIEDPEGAELTVQAGAPVKVRTVLAHNPVQVHQSVMVSCVVEDAYGNLQDYPTEVEAPEEVTVEDHSVMAEEVGSYIVRCAVLEVNPDSINVVATMMDVVAADPAEVTLEASPSLNAYSVDAEVSLTWEVRDAYGNLVLTKKGMKP